MRDNEPTKTSRRLYPRESTGRLRKGTGGLPKHAGASKCQQRYISLLTAQWRMTAPAPNPGPAGEIKPSCQK